MTSIVLCTYSLSSLSTLVWGIYECNLYLFAPKLSWKMHFSYIIYKIEFLRQKKLRGKGFFKNINVVFPCHSFMLILHFSARRCPPSSRRVTRDTLGSPGRHPDTGKAEAGRRSGLRKSTSGYRNSCLMVRGSQTAWNLFRQPPTEESRL